LIWLAFTAAVALWWLLTGIALICVHQEAPAVRKLVLGVATVVAGTSLWILPETAATHSVSSVLAGFVTALLIWGWLELVYLMGYVTGPNKHSAPGGVATAKRFMLALATIIYHEVLALTIIVLAFLQVGLEGDNLVTPLVLSVLWIMRGSTKLNLFFGVRHFNENWLPNSLRYVTSFIVVGKNSALMVPTTFMAALLAAAFFFAGLNATSPTAELTLYLLAWLSTLAVLEHFFLMYPLGEHALWRWAVRSE
jgi:putative photosynthetic complex assembly protein 2